jgi:hypothetical protein
VHLTLYRQMLHSPSQTIYSNYHTHLHTRSVMKRIPLLKKILILGISCITHPHIPLSGPDTYRYDVIKTLLNRYTRPTTFLHLWPHTSQVAFAVAQEYDCVTVVLDPQATRFQALCQEYDNIILLNKTLSVKGLHSLTECEHMDLTLVSNITEQFPDEWKKAIDKTLDMGDYTILEAPPAHTKLHKAVVEYIRKKGGERIGMPSEKISHEVGELYLCKCMKKYLIKRRWNYTKAWKLGEYTIESSFDTKKFIKQKIKPKGFSVTVWHPGINLYTFKQLNGIYPTYDVIRSMLYPLASIQHNDLRIFNLIIQGKKLVPIDVNENERHADPSILLPEIIHQFRKLSLKIVTEFDGSDSKTCVDECENFGE